MHIQVKFDDHVTVVSPITAETREGKPYFLAGKEYEGKAVDDAAAWVKDEFGRNRFILFKACAHISYLNWEVRQVEPAVVSEAI